MKTSEVWLVNFDPTVGAEIQKSRPAIIVNRESIGILPLRVIVPVTDWKDRFADRAWMVRVEPDGSNGLTKVSAVDTFQIRSASVERFLNRLGKLSDEDMARVKRALAVIVLDLKLPPDTQV